MKRSSILWLALLVGCEDSPSDPRIVEPVSAESLAAHVEVLAHDSLNGRRTGSEYELEAARYIRDRFFEYGLPPGAPDYFQEFPIGRAVDNQGGLSSRNVIGIVRGQGSLAGQWVVVGAHYDHVGVQHPVDSDSIYNGADDNASGTATLLELARLLSAEYEGTPAATPRRSVMFHAYGAEEVGLVGSRYFCNHPTVSMADVVAMLNFDMVGRLREDRLSLIGVQSDLSSIAQDQNNGSLQLVFNNSLSGRSDHACFQEAGKPVLFFHTGLHEQYHSPFDESWRINAEGMRQVAELGMSVLKELVSRPTPPRVGG